MRDIGRLLVAESLDFRDVVKANTYYGGGTGAAALHHNIRIRSSSYPTPGPAHDAAGGTTAVASISRRARASISAVTTTSVMVG